MKYIPPINGDTEDPDRSWPNADPDAGVTGARPDGRAIEHPMRELVSLITAAGLVPDQGDLTQVQQAIAALFLAKTGGTLTGALTVVEHLIARSAADGGNANLWLRNDDGTNRGIFFYDSSLPGIELRGYEADGVTSAAFLRLLQSGAAEVKADPTTPLGIATKQFVESFAGITLETGADYGIITLPVPAGNDLIIQFGTKTGLSGEGEQVVTLPETFPNRAIWGAVASVNPTGATTGASYCERKSLTTTTLTGFLQSAAAGTTTTAMDWLTIGD